MSIVHIFAGLACVRTDDSIVLGKIRNNFLCHFCSEQFISRQQLIAKFTVFEMMTNSYEKLINIFKRCQNKGYQFHYYSCFPLA